MKLVKKKNAHSGEGIICNNIQYSMINKQLSQPILQFESLATFSNIRHFTTTRYGGCSTGAFASFNLGNYSGDVRENLDTNRRTLCKLLGLDQGKLLVPHQLHGTEIAVIDDQFLNLEEARQAMMLEGKDALVTSCKGVCIVVSTADCVPVLIYDAGKRVVAAVHAGWRGTCRRMVQKVIRQMMADYGCTPAEIHAAIGPSIGKEAFEVGNEVYEAFRNNGFDMATIACTNPLTGKYHINLWEANRQQMTELGIPPQQIEIAGICTYQNSDFFFSARKLGIESGRMLTGIWMTE